MNIPSLTWLTHPLNHRPRLRTLLIVPFVLQIVGTISVVSYLCVLNSNLAVRDLAEKLQVRASEQVEEHLNNFLEDPRHVVQLMSSAVESGMIDLDDRNKTERYLLNLAKIYPKISYFNYGLEKGFFLGVGRVDNVSDRLHIEEALPPNNHILYQYGVISEGRDQKSVKKLDFGDFKAQDWYTQPKAAGRFIWTDIYHWTDNPQVVAIGAGQPLYEPDGKVMGVVEVDMFLAGIQDYLRSLKVTPHGQVFIVDRGGMVVATSGHQLGFEIKNNTATRLPLSKFPDPAIQAAAAQIAQQLGNLETVKSPHLLSFDWQHQRQLLRISPWQDGDGLHWLIGVLIPESDFTSRIDENNERTKIITFFALILSIIVASLTSSWVTRPILRLSQATKAIALRDFTGVGRMDCYGEIGDLSQAFNEMALQLQQAFQTLEADRQRLIHFLEAIPMGIAIHRADGSLFYINQTGRLLLMQDPVDPVASDGLAQEYHIYRAGTDELYPVSDLPSTLALEGQAIVTDDIEIHLEGGKIPIQVAATPVWSADGKVEYSIAVFQDITQRRQFELILQSYNQDLAKQVYERTQALELEIQERRRAEAELHRVNAKLKQLATIDPLTQIPNRRYFDEHFAAEWQRLTRSKQPLSLLLLDIDYFKRYNDYYGHPQGDVCLIQVAQALTQSVHRPADLVARLGGEEFAVILPETGESGAISVAKQIHRNLQTLNLKHAKSEISDYVTISIGIGTLIPHAHFSLSQLVDGADRALFDAKQYRNCYRIFSFQSANLLSQH